MLVDAIWDKISGWITDFEYHERETDFYTSKALKTAMVRWISSSISMVYFAFILPNFDTHLCNVDGQESCPHYYRALLRSQLLGLLIVRFLMLATFNTMLKPYLIFRWKTWKKNLSSLEL